MCVFGGTKEQILQQLKPFSGLLIAASPREDIAHQVHPFSETNPSAVGIFVSVRAARIPMQISNHVRSAHFEAPADIPPLKSSAHPWLRRFSPLLVLYLPSKLDSHQAALKTGAQHQSCSILYQIVQSFVMNTYIWVSFHIRLFFFFCRFQRKMRNDSLHTAWACDVIGRLCQKHACQARRHFLTENVKPNSWFEGF